MAYNFFVYVEARKEILLLWLFMYNAREVQIVGEFR